MAKTLVLAVQSNSGLLALAADIEKAAAGREIVSVSHTVYVDSFSSGGSNKYSALVVVKE